MIRTNLNLILIGFASSIFFTSYSHAKTSCTDLYMAMSNHEKTYTIAPQAAPTSEAAAMIEKTLNSKAAVPQAPDVEAMKVAKTLADKEFHTAIQDSDCDLKAPLPGNIPNMSLNAGQSLLSVAASIESKDMIEDLLKAGADVNYMPPPDKNVLAFSPLVLAASRGNVDILKQILKAGADVNAGKPTPLNIALEFNRIDVIPVLMMAGAKPDAETEKLLKLGDYSFFSRSKKIKGSEERRYAAGALVLANLSDFNFCELDHEQVSGYFYMAKGMHNKQAESLSEKIEKYSKESNHDSLCASQKTISAKSRVKKPSSGNR